MFSTLQPCPSSSLIADLLSGALKSGLIFASTEQR